MGTRLDFSSAYHPQTDGQSEIVNSIVLDLLKNYVNDVDHHNQWEKYLPLVEYAYNNTVHSSTGTSTTGLGRLRHLLTGALGDRHGGSLPVILQLDYTYSASLVCF